MASSTSAGGTNPSPQDQFSINFQTEVAVIQESLAKLFKLPANGGERIDAIDHCLSKLARLQAEVQSAASYIPAYDQKKYSEGVKALHEQLDQTRVALQPRQKFAFKNSIKKNDSALSLAGAAELESQQKARIFKDPRTLPSSNESSFTGTSDLGTPALGPTDSEPESLANPATVTDQITASPATDGPQIRKMSFASETSVLLSSHTGVHIILPSSASHATSSGSVTNISSCIIDMSTPTATGKPFATLAIKDVKSSLLICGSVSGPAHVTGVENSVIVVAARQFRMHECKDCIVYLHDISQPIIEDCHGIRFAPIPEIFKPTAADLSGSANRWDQIQDFKWHRSEPNPNWIVLPEDQKVDPEQWSKIISTEFPFSLKESLRIAGVKMA